MLINWKAFASKIPHQVQVASKVIYPVMWVEKFEGEKHVGITHFDPKQIVISSNQSDKERVMTYLHEVLHAASNEHKIGLTEKQVLKLEKALYYAFKPGNLFKE